MGKTSIYNLLFAKFYDGFMYNFEKGLYKHRNELIAPLKGKILEVGSGTGINFEHYHNDADVTALEPSKPMIKVSKSKKCDCQTINYLDIGVTDENIFNTLEAESFDYIISTLVLCTISNPEIAISSYRKLLKPNGKLIILEHIHSTKKKDKILQNIANPMWKAFSEGCNLNRNTDLLLLKGGFEPINSEYFVSTLRWIKGVYEISKHGIK